MRKKSIKFLVLVILALMIIGAYAFPYLYLVLTSFKPPSEVLSIPPKLFPEQFDMQNYLHIFDYEYLPRSFLNSLIIASFTTLLTLMIAIPAAYGVVRYNKQYGRTFLGITLITRLIPYVSVALPLFFIMRYLNLMGTYVSVIVGHMTISLPVAIWLLSSFFEGMPLELEEAAIIDGCTRFGALLRIIIPISLGGIVVTAIFSFLASWNDFLFSLMLTTTRTKTVPIAIAEFDTQYGLFWGTMTSLATLYSLPIIFISFFLQKRIVRGTTMGALKQ